MLAPQPQAGFSLICRRIRKQAVPSTGGSITKRNDLKGELGELPCGQQLERGERLLEHSGCDNSYKSLSAPLTGAALTVAFSLQASGGFRIISSCLEEDCGRGSVSCLFIFR